MLNTFGCDIARGDAVAVHAASRRPADDLPGDLGMVGHSAGFKAVCSLVRKVAATEATVLLLGESGVGKELLSQTLHRLSRRCDRPFVAVNCGAIPEALTESELFGVKKGAFTGAATSRPGRFERAHGGTLFLDEIGTLNGTAQAKLLRALQGGEIERIGDTVTRKVDVRIIAATNVNLCEAIRRGAFREDLFYRLNVFPIRVPPLRERGEDIPILLHHFVKLASARHAKSIPGVDAAAIDAMMNHDWPGNIRELENIVERAVILAEPGQQLDLRHFAALCPHAAHGHGHAAEVAVECNGGGALPSLEEAEVRLLRLALAKSGGNLSQAARLLKISRPKLAYRLRRNGIT